MTHASDFLYDLPDTPGGSPASARPLGDRLQQMIDALPFDNQGEHLFYEIAVLLRDCHSALSRAGQRSEGPAEEGVAELAAEGAITEARLAAKAAEIARLRQQVEALQRLCHLSVEQTAGIAAAREADAAEAESALASSAASLKALTQERDAARQERDRLESERGDWTGEKCESCGGYGEDNEARPCTSCAGTGEKWATWRDRYIEASAQLDEAREALRTMVAYLGLHIDTFPEYRQIYDVGMAALSGAPVARREG